MNPPSLELKSRFYWQSYVGRTWSTAPRRKKLLVVDDDASLLRMLGVLFGQDFEVTIASDGPTALHSVEDTSPDLIVLDLEMPYMNGRAVFKEIRSRGLEIPVLILSAYGAATASEELGAEAYMDKPFEPDRLLERVIQLTR